MVAKDKLYFIDKTQLHHPLCVEVIVGGFNYTMTVKNGQLVRDKFSIPGNRLQVAADNVNSGVWVSATEDEAMAHLYPDRPVTTEDAW